MYGLIECIAIHQTAIVSAHFFKLWYILQFYFNQFWNINLLFINGSCTPSLHIKNTSLTWQQFAVITAKVMFPYKAVGTYNRRSDNTIFPRMLHNGSFASKSIPGNNTFSSEVFTNWKLAKLISDCAPVLKKSDLYEMVYYSRYNDPICILINIYRKRRFQNWLQNYNRSISSWDI